MTEKTCTTCGDTKPVGAFHANRAERDGRRRECRSCFNAYCRSRWANGATNRQAVYERDRRWRQANPVSVALINRRSRLKRKYGITVEEYDAMFVAQGGRCAACDSTDSGDPRFDTFAVDHDHETGKVRGLLCAGCNRALGLVKDNVDTLMSLAAYLLKDRDIIGTSA